MKQRITKADLDQMISDITKCAIQFKEKTGHNPEMCYIDPITADCESGEIGTFSGIPVSVSPGLNKGEISMVNLTTGAEKKFIRMESSPLVGYDKEKLLRLRKEQLVKMLIEAWENAEDSSCIPDAYEIRKHEVEWYMAGSHKFKSMKQFTEGLGETYRELLEAQMGMPSPFAKRLK
jgi:hypothetical protein